MSRQPPLGASVKGPSAVLVWHLLADSLPARIRQLERTGAHPDVVRHLRATGGELQEAARQYRAWENVRNGSEAVTAPLGGRDAGSDRTTWVGTGFVARELACSPRWVSTLCVLGRLRATRVGRRWRIDLSSVEDYRRGADAAA